MSHTLAVLSPILPSSALPVCSFLELFTEALILHLEARGSFAHLTSFEVKCDHMTCVGQGNVSRGNICFKISNKLYEQAHNHHFFVFSLKDYENTFQGETQSLY